MLSKGAAHQAEPVSITTARKRVAVDVADKEAPSSTRRMGQLGMPAARTVAAVSPPSPTAAVPRTAVEPAAAAAVQLTRTAMFGKGVVVEADSWPQQQQSLASAAAVASAYEGEQA